MSIPPVYSSYCYDDVQLAHCPQNSQQAESRGQAPAHDLETQDTASFSDEAIKKSQGTGEDAEAKNKNFSALSGEENQGNINTSHSAGKTGSSGRAGEADAAASTAQETIKSIRKQIKEVKKQLEKAESRMTEAQEKLEQAKAGIAPEPQESSPDSGAQQTRLNQGAAGQACPAMNISSMEGASEALSSVSIVQNEMQGIAQEVKALKGQLQALEQKLVQAMETAYGTGDGPPGAAGGTRAAGFGNSLS